MKKCLLAISMLLVMAAAFSQPGKKPPAKEKPPTQKEMDAMLKEMQKAMDDMSPEDKKTMDSMGIKLPNTKSIQKSMSGVTDAQLKKAYEEDSRIVPLKDAARIAAIPKTVPDNRMGSYISMIQNKATSALKPEVTKMADKIYSYIKSNSKNNSEAGNMAVGLWLAGKIEMAYYTLGKICADEPGNTDNLSNYASMLSMLGAQHLAIPVLNNLNAKFPNNSSLLNNLGQAWFGLGEIAKAEKYLDSAIRIYSYHTQANYTKSFIEESKGNTAAATEHVKRSIKKAYSNEKENRLNKLGYKLKGDDLNWDFPMPQDPLGLEKFKWPAYPKNVSESEILEKEWDAFNVACKNKLIELEIKGKKAEEEMIAFNEQLTQQLLQAGNKGIWVDPVPRFAYKAMVKLKYLVEGKDGSLAYNYKTKGEAIANANIQVSSFEETLSNQLVVLEKNYEDQFGEGKPNPFDAACADDTKAKNAFLSSANKLLEDKSTDWLNFLRRKINDEIYYNQYTMWPQQFELAKIHAQMTWLTSIQGQARFKYKSSWCQNKNEEAAIKPFKLQAFDDVNCQYNATMDLKIMKFTNNCSRMTSEFDFMFLNYVRKDDFERAEGDTYISSTIKISAEAGKDLKAGPLKVEAKIGGGVEFEFGPQGIEDVALIGEAKVGAGTGIMDEDEKTGSPGIGIAGKDAFPTTVEAGVEGRISIISGKGSVAGTGILKGINITEW
jgi:tetratricopeptide (TPR) repeat protein